MLFNRGIVFLLILNIFSLIAAGQDKFTQVIRGVVTDKGTALPLPGANVILSGSGPFRGTATDEKGRFVLDNVPVGRQTIRVSYMGYQDQVLNHLNVISGKEMVLTIQLEEAVLQLGEVEIMPDRRKDLPLNEMAAISARSFTVEETERYAGSVGDPARMASGFLPASIKNLTRKTFTLLA